MAVTKMTSSPSSFVDPTAPLRDFFNQVSNKYTKLELANKEAELQAKRDEESSRRFALQEGRAQLLAGREQEKYDLGKEMQSFYKDFAKTYNPDDVRTAKAKTIFNLTDDQLSSDKGKALLKEIPLYQEDIDNFYSSKFTEKFGTTFDPKAVRSYYGDVSSLASLQEKENERTKALNEANKDYLNFRLQALKALVPSSVRDTYDAEGNYVGTTASSGGSNSTKRKAPKAFSDILVSGLVKEFEDNSGWNPLASERQEAQKVATNLLGMLQKEGSLKATPAEAERVVKTVLDRAKTGGSLTRISASDDEIASLATKALNDIRQYDSGVKAAGVNPYKDQLGRLASGQGVGIFSPADIRAVNRKKAFDNIKAILDGGLKQSSVDTSSQPKRSVLDQGQILSNVGVTTSPVPDVPRFASSQLPPAGTSAKQTSSPDKATLVPSAAEERALSAELESEGPKPEKDSVNRLQVLRNTVPSTSVNDEGIVRLNELFQSNPTPEQMEAVGVEVGMSPAEMADAFKQYDSTIEKSGGIGPIRQAKIDRYNEGKALVDEINKRYGKGIVDSDTLFILPYNAEGKEKTWEEVVKQINNHSSIRGFNKLDTKDYNEGKKDPITQQRLIDKANRIIAADFKGRAAEERMFSNMGDSIASGWDATSDFFRDKFSVLDPTSPEFKKRALEREQRPKELEKEIQFLNNLETFINRNQGTVDMGGNDFSKSFDAFTESLNDNANNQALVGTLGLTAVGKLGRPLYYGGRSLLSKGRQLLKPPAPVPAPNPVSSAVVGPTRAQYYDGLSRTSAFDRSQLRRLNEWLQKNAPLNTPR